jgi:hypothetical protein
MGPATSLTCPRYYCLVDNPSDPSSPTKTGPNYDYGNAEMDLRHRLSYMTSYNLPFGSSFKGIEGAIVKGWATSVSGYWQTGGSFSVNPLVFGPVASGRADEIANPKNMQFTTGTCTLTAGVHYGFNPCAFTNPTPGTFGNQERNQLFGPHTWSTNATMGKDFPVYENYKLTFRAEAFNLTNTTNDAAPGSTVGGTGYGIITRNGSTGRQFQFSLRLAF